MREGFLFACETAWDWAEDKEIGVRLRRDDDLRWCVRVSFADYYGKFFADVPIHMPPRGEGEIAKEAADKFVAHFRERLDKACQQARQRRIEDVKKRLLN